MERGDLPAAVVKEHLVSLAESRGSGKLLAASWDYFPSFHQTSIFATDAFIAKHPDIVRRTLKAYWRSQVYALEHQDEVIEFGENLLGVDGRIVKTAWERFRSHLRRSGEIDPKALENTINVLSQFDFMDRPVYAKDILDLSCLPDSSSD